MDKDQILMQQLFKDFNCDEETIGNNIVHYFHNDKTSIDKLEKYDINILIEINKQVTKFKDNLFDELLRRRNILEYDKGDIHNIKCGFDISTNCEAIINQFIDEKYSVQNKILSEQINKLYKKNLNNMISMLKCITVIFVILYIFYYVCKNINYKN